MRKVRWYHDVHVKVLEGIVSANTFLTGAVLIGITGTITPSSTIPRNCVAGDDIARNFFLFEILSFGLFLFSSLLAQGMKLAVTLLATDHELGDRGDGEHDEPKYTMSATITETLVPACQIQKTMEPRRTVLRFARPVILLAAGFSIVGTFFLLLSMVNAIQLKFGILSCNIPLAVGATFPLSVLVVVGLLFYGSALFYALNYYLPYDPYE